MTVVNLEGPLTTASNHLEKEFPFSGAPEYTKILTSSSVEAVTLANNHSEDYYEAGLQDTKKYLDEVLTDIKADRLISILDWNGVQLDGTTEQIMPMGDIELKFKAFGYNTIVCDGHNVAALSAAIETAKSVKGVPSIILAKTVKGKGISFMEGKNTWHGAPVKDADYEAAMKELGGVQ